MKKALIILIYLTILNNCEETDGNYTDSISKNSCENNQYLFNNKCILDCPSWTITNEYTYSCQYCEENSTFYFINKLNNNCEFKDDTLKLVIEYLDNPRKFKLLWKPIEDQTYGQINSEDIAVGVNIKGMSEGEDYSYRISDGKGCGNQYNCVNLTIDYPLGVSVNKYTEITISLEFKSLFWVRQKNSTFYLSEFENKIPISNITIRIERSQQRDSSEFLIGVQGARDANEANTIMQGMKVIEMGRENPGEMNFTWQFIKSDENNLYWSLVNVERKVESVGIEYFGVEFQEAELYKIEDKVVRVQCYPFDGEEINEVGIKILRYSVWGIQGFVILAFLITINAEFIMESPYFLTNMLEVLCSFVIVVLFGVLIGIIDSFLKKLNYYLYSTVCWKKFHSLINYNIIHFCAAFIYSQGLIFAIYNIYYLHPFNGQKDSFTIINFWSSCGFLFIGLIYLAHLIFVTNVDKLMKRELLIHEQLIQKEEDIKTKLQRFIRWISLQYYSFNTTHKLCSISKNECLLLNSRKNSQLAYYYYIIELFKLTILAILIVTLGNYPFALTIAIQGVLLLFFVCYIIIRPQKRLFDLLIQLLSQGCIIVGFGCVTTLTIFQHYDFVDDSYYEIRKQFGNVLLYSMIVLCGLQLASQFFAFIVFFFKVKQQRLFESTIVKSTNQKLQQQQQQQQQIQPEVHEFIETNNEDENDTEKRKERRLKYLSEQQQSIKPSRKQKEIQENDSLQFGGNLSAWAFKDSQVQEQNQQQQQERKKWNKKQENVDIDPLQIILNHNEKKKQENEKNQNKFKVQGISHFDIPSPKDKAYGKENSYPGISIELEKKSSIPENVQNNLFNLKKRKRDQASKLEEESPLQARNNQF